MKYVNQGDYPDWLYVTRCEMEGEEYEKGRTTTVATSGCGLCSAVMVAQRLLPNCEYGVKEAIRTSYNSNANYMIGTKYIRFAPAFAEELGLDLEMTNDPDRLRYCLRTGGAAIILVKGDRDDYKGVFSKGGHYVVAISEERDGRIAVLDPSYKEGKYDTEGRKGKVELREGVVCLCDIQVLVEDSKPADPAFYLFWRK